MNEKCGRGNWNVKLNVGGKDLAGYEIGTTKYPFNISGSSSPRSMGLGTSELITELERPNLIAQKI